jgi:YrhK-like protein
VNKVLKLRRESLGFAVGSFCFAIGACPGYLNLVGQEAANITFFVGSIFFTLAGFIQFRMTGRWRRGAWKSKEDWDDWWSAAVQFVGTICFNISCFFALFLHISLAQSHNHVWRPDAVGSLFFLVSSFLAIIATKHADELWDPDARNWWSTWLNMAGSIAFGISAAAAYVVPNTTDPFSSQWVNLGTFIGAICFMVAALLVKPQRRQVKVALAERKRSESRLGHDPAS